MNRSPLSVLCICCVVGFTFQSAGTLHAQSRLPRSGDIPPPPPPKKSGAKNDIKYIGKTIVNVELFTNRGGLVLQLNQWRSSFQKLGVSIRIRQGVPNEKPETRERIQGNLRLIRVIGYLERDGKLAFENRSFSLGEGNKLKEWLNELKTYGAEGSPDGQPAWGLNRDAFLALNKVLRESVTARTAGVSLRDAIEQLNLAEQYPVRFSQAALSELKGNAPDNSKVIQNVSGLSQGTALALVLKEQGFGFRPLRTPSGSIELVIEPLTKTTDVWPIGWDLPKTVSRTKAFPSLMKAREMEFKKMDFTLFLKTVSKTSGVPILLDRYAISKKGIPLNKIQVSTTYRKTSWGVLLRRFVGTNRMTRKYLLDESGRPFVLITTLEVGSSRK